MKQKWNDVIARVDLNQLMKTDEKINEILMLKLQNFENFLVRRQIFCSVTFVIFSKLNNSSLDRLKCAQTVLAKKSY